MPQFQYKEQQFQKDAVAAVAGVFRGVDFSPLQAIREFQLADPANPDESSADEARPGYVLENFRNVVEANLREVRDRNGIADAGKLALKGEQYPVLDTHMETGTGKTFTFINTIFELNKLYGLTHFVVIVPSVAIREGVKKSFATTGEYFERMYQQRIKVNEVTSAKARRGRKAPPSGVSDFIHGEGLTVLVMTNHAFIRSDNIINEELEGFFAGDARTPMAAIATKNPVLIVDEPQRTEGPKTLERIKDFNPLFRLRYSATFRSGQVKNLVYTLDSYDAFEKKLVKSIRVADYKKGPTDAAFLGVNKVTPQGAELTAVNTAGNPLNVVISKPEQSAPGRLFAKTANAEYKNLLVTGFNAIDGTVAFSDGRTLKSGDYTGHAQGNDDIVDEVMMRDTINRHLEKERGLFARGIKCISLFFIDKVRDYRDYESAHGRGRLQALFERCYAECAQEKTAAAPNDYEYLNRWAAAKAHGGYFSADAKRNQKIDRGAAEANNEAARELQGEITELILRDKENILNPDNELRFIFAHSALREGWDNPNVFQICKLRTGYAETNLVQEVGRGLRICVNRELERQDTDALGDEFAEVNNLDVLTLGNGQFISNLQSDLSGRRCMDKRSYLTITSELLREIYGINEIPAGKAILALYDAGKVDETGQLLVRDGIGEILENAQLDPAKLLDKLPQTPEVRDARTTGARGRNYQASESHYMQFKKLWEWLHQNVAYHVEYSEGFCQKIIGEINEKLSVEPLVIEVETAKVTAQNNEFSADPQHSTRRGEITSNLPTRVFLNRLAEKTKLPRNTIIDILTGIDAEKFAEIGNNPLAAIDQIVDTVTGVIHNNIVDSVRYEKLDGFRDEKTESDITLTDKTFEAKHYIELDNLDDYQENNLWEEIAPYDSENPERRISESALTDGQITVFAKLPRAVNIPAPMYPKGINPDFAIVVRGDNGKHDYYFVAEAKPTTDTGALRPEEKRRVDLLKKYFEGIGADVKFKVVSNYKQLLELFPPKNGEAQ